MKSPELFVEFGQYVKSKYDFYDEATTFFFDTLEIMFQKRTQTLNNSTVSTFMTEDQERLKHYRRFGGWKTLDSWSTLAIAEDFKNYFEVLKKYSLLREYQRNGYAVEKIIAHPRFEMFSALDIYRLIRGKVDRIHTVILQNNEEEILNSKVLDLIQGCLEKPDMGVLTPYPCFNEMFRGLKTESMMAVGMLSNAGKSRFMFKIIAYLALVLKIKVTVLLNEMSVNQMRLCLLTTVLNNEEFQHEHGIVLSKKEREIALGLYRDDHGNFIDRQLDAEGNYIEELAVFLDRIQASSQEYRNVLEIAKWIEDETQGVIFAKDISSAYDERSLELEIRKANRVHGIQYVFYDTLKDPINSIGDWTGLKITTTKLAELARELKIFIYGSIQLTDETNFVDPDCLTSSNISNCKQLKFVLDSLLLFKEIPKNKYSKYQYYAVQTDWGEPRPKPLDETKRYYIGNVDKNRFGEKAKLLFSVDLDTNEWYELGEVVRK